MPRRKTVCDLFLLTLVTTLLVTVTQSSLFAQTPAESVVPESDTVTADVEPIAASPLSAFQAGPNPTTTRLNNALHVARGHLAIPTSGHHLNVETKSVDLSATIKRYSELKEVSAMDARLEAIAYLGLAPKKREKRGDSDGPTFEIDGVDVFKITAPKNFFKMLPHMLKSLEHGKIEIEIHVKIIEIDSRLSNRFNRYLHPGTEEVVCSRLPVVEPTATDNFDIESKPFVSTTTVVRQNMPVTLGIVTKENHKKLEAMIASDQNCRVVNAPAIRLYPGQAGTFSDATLRPYVVGLAGATHATGLSATQPVVQPVEDGTTVRLRAIPRGTHTQLFGDVAISEVIGVKKLTYTSGELKKSQSIQIPTQKIQQMNFSTNLKPGQSVLIDPNFYRTPDSDDRRGKNARRQLKTLLLFRTSVKEPN